MAHVANLSIAILLHTLQAASDETNADEVRLLFILIKVWDS